MESGAELVKVVVAIVTSFQMAADTLDVIRERKEQKKRKRDKEVEELLEIKILHKSLLEGAVQCRQHCERKRQQYDRTFTAGDTIASTALKDVVVVLQTDLIPALLHARAVESVALDFTILHETSITSRKDATRAMDQLCQRIATKMHASADDFRDAWSPNDYSMRSRSVSVQSSNLSLPSLAHSFVPSPPPEKMLPPLPTALAIRRPSDVPSHGSRSVAVYPSPTLSALQPRVSHLHLSRHGSDASIRSGPRSTPGDRMVSAPIGFTNLEVHHHNGSQNAASRSSSIGDDYFAVHNRDTDGTGDFSIQRSRFANSKLSKPATVLPAPTYRPYRRPSMSEPEPMKPTEDVTVSVVGLGLMEPSTIEVELTALTPPVESHRQPPNPPPVVDHPMSFSIDAGDPNHPPVIDHPMSFSIDAGDCMDTREYPNTVASAPPTPFFVDAGIVEDTESVVIPENETTPKVLSISHEPFEDVTDDPPIHREPSPVLPEESRCNVVSPAFTEPDTVSEASFFHGNSRQQCDSEVDAISILSQGTEVMVAQDIWLSPRIEKIDEHDRALRAPEVLSYDMGAQFQEKLRPVPDLANEKFSASLTQADYQERLSSLPKGQENVWMPLARPAMHNRYHGFCKGAWQIRKAAAEGIHVAMTPSLKEPILYWKCTACEFQSKAPNADALPDYILFNQKYNIRHRWLFLAKSHRTAEFSCVSLDNYKYGCIFCAAQGRPSAVHEKLEHLFVHIISKHKTAMMTPEVKAKTKCIVGPLSGQIKDWDINIPEMTQKTPGTAADEFFISASKFWNRRKNKK